MWSGTALLVVATLGFTGGTWWRRARERAVAHAEEENAAAVQRAAADEAKERDTRTAATRNIEQQSREPLWPSCLKNASIALDQQSVLGVSAKEAMRLLAVGKQRVSFNGDDESGFFQSLGFGRPLRFKRGTFGFVPSGEPATFCVEWSRHALSRENSLAFPGVVTVNLPDGHALRAKGSLVINRARGVLTGTMCGETRTPSGDRISVSWATSGVNNSSGDLRIIGARGHSYWQSIPAR